MRNSISLFASTVFFAVLFCSSCQKERVVEELEVVDSSADVVRTLSFSVDAFEAEDGTTATKSTYDADGYFYFAATDTVGIFPSKGAQVYFEIAGEDVGKRYVMFDGGGWAFKESSSYWSYFPLVGDFYLEKNHIPVEYFDVTQNRNEGLDHISPLDFLYTDKCTVQEGSLSFSYHRLNCILRPRVTLPAGTYSKIVVQAETDVFVSKGYYDLTANKPSIIGTEFTNHLTLNLENISFDHDTAFVGNLITAPVDISDMPIKVIIYSGDLPKYYYTYQRSTSLEANVPYGLRCNDLKEYVEKQERDLSFYPEATACIMGKDIIEKPVLTGNYTSVVYSSSDETVATVDAEGNITSVGTGIVTITAIAEEDDQYLQGSSSYTLTVLDSSIPAYVKVSSIIESGFYLIVDAEDKRLFKGTADGSYINISPENNVIIDNNETLAGYEFSLETLGDNNYLKFNDGRFLVCDYSSNGNGTTGITYVNSQPEVKYPYTLTYGKNGAFFFSTTQIGSPTNTGQVLYYKGGSGSGTNIFKIGGSGTNIGVHLYISTRERKQDRYLSFNLQNFTCTLGNSPEKPILSGTYTAVTYSSSDESIAKVDANGKVTPLAAGIVTITATAEEDEQYNACVANYTLRILNPPSEDWVDKGIFNLENAALYNYLNDANSSYSDIDDATNSVMASYATGSAYSYIDRKDCPEPVKITWVNIASGSTVIDLYEDQTLTVPIWSQKATEESTSADLYNLIPGRTYYYTVSEDSIVWEKGYFNTTGRRRMIKVSNIERKGHANNCRDLGGLEVMDKGTKKTIKYGYIFRGTNMDKTTDHEKTILTDFLNIGMDIDLRFGNSTNPGTDEGSSYCYQPFKSPYNVGYINPGFNSFNDLTDSVKVNRVVMAIINTARSGKASYFHCYIGADRTGYFGMLIEGLLGVSEKDCSIDYELTSFSEAAELRYRTGQPRDYYFRQGITFLRGQAGETFQDKIENYLVNKIGISKPDIDEFKSIVLN